MRVRERKSKKSKFPSGKLSYGGHMLLLAQHSANEWHLFSLISFESNYENTTRVQELTTGI